MIELPYTFGDYTLTETLDEKNKIVFFAGIQNRMARPVQVAILRPEAHQEAEVNHFLASAKAKAQTQYPLLASVFEASNCEDKWFYAQEAIVGENLDDLRKARKHLSVTQTITIIQTIGKSFLYFNENQISIDNIDLKNIYLNHEENDTIRLDNIVNHHSCSPDDLNRHMVGLASQLAPILPLNVSGATRLNTLTSWMIYGQKAKLLTWDQVFDMLDLIEEQMGLKEDQTTALLKSKKINTEGFLPLPRWAWISLGAAIVVLGGITFILFNPPTASANVTEKKQLYPKETFSIGTTHMSTVTLPKGKKIDIATHEIAIDAYARFLNMLTKLPDSRTITYNHPDQPASKLNHIPRDWDNLYAAAQANGTWDGKKISLRHPVVNVDWWDAYAYAQYSEGRLPTAEEWLAVARAAPSPNVGDGFCAIDDYTQDVDKNGITGLLSGVQEWTSSKQIDPLHPMEPKGWVICGGDASTPDKTATRYERDPSTQKSNLGFRIVKPKPNKK